MLAKQTRPDIMWFINIFSRFMNEPTIDNLICRRASLEILKVVNRFQVQFSTRQRFRTNRRNRSRLKRRCKRSTIKYWILFQTWKKYCSSQLASSKTNSCLTIMRGRVSWTSRSSTRGHFLRSLLKEMSYPQNEPSLLQLAMIIRVLPIWRQTQYSINSRNTSIETIFHL